MTGLNGMTAVWNKPTVSHYEFMYKGRKIAEVDTEGHVVSCDLDAMDKLSRDACDASQAIAALVVHAYLRGLGELQIGKASPLNIGRPGTMIWDSRNGPPPVLAGTPFGDKR